MIERCLCVYAVSFMFLKKNAACQYKMQNYN